MFKTMTAHGGVSMWLKYQDERDENAWTAKLMFATNNRLHYRDQSGALTRRLLIVECPNSVPDAKQGGDLLKRLEPELGAFAAACIRLALLAQERRQYPESAEMRSLLADIETNGDSIKLWLTENCVFEDTAFESTATLYEDYRVWCVQNGVFCAGPPKMRGVIMTYRPSVVATRRRIVDSETGEMKLVWGLVGVRLRTPDDDLDEDATPADSGDPVPVPAPVLKNPTTTPFVTVIRQIFSSALERLWTASHLVNVRRVLFCQTTGSPDLHGTAKSIQYRLNATHGNLWCHRMCPKTPERFQKTAIYMTEAVRAARDETGGWLQPPALPRGAGQYYTRGCLFRAR